MIAKINTKKNGKIEVFQEVLVNEQILVKGWNCKNKIRKIGVTCQKEKLIRTSPVKDSLDIFRQLILMFEYFGSSFISLK